MVSYACNRPAWVFIETGYTGAFEAVRQGQQNRRGRGRNRKNHNPLSRSFESNGPDVKIRGTPAHIAEKYISLARDAQSSGDPVLAENYLQHAEHYSRIIMAYREQMGQAGGEFANGNGQRMHGEGAEGGDEFGDEGDDFFDDGFPQPPMGGHQPHQGQGGHQGGGHQGQGHQPRHQNNYEGGGGRHDRQFRRDRDHNRFRDRNNDRDRGDRGDRGGEGRPERPAPEQRQASERPAPERQPEPAGESGGGGGEPRRRERFQQQPHEQPEFLRRPVRRARSSEPDETAPSKED